MVRPQRDYAVQAGGTVSPEISEACGEDAKAHDAMREGPTWIAISNAAARATASVNAEPRSSVNVDNGLTLIPG